MTEREKIISLARECNVKSLKEPRYHMNIYELTGQAIEAFHKAAQNEAYEKAAELATQVVCGTVHNVTVYGHPVSDAIYKLKEQS